MSSAIHLLKLKCLALKLFLYRKIFIPLKAEQIRHKRNIKIIFVLENLGAWKSESLYLQMLKDTRFNPLIVIGRSDEEDDCNNLRSYLETKKYIFKEVGYIGDSLWKDYKPDIIFYQKPYGGIFLNNLKALFCYCPYSFHNSIQDWAFKTSFIYNSWQVYYENPTLCDYYTTQLGKGSKNGYATGIPPMDELLTPKELLENPWKGDSTKKRIIFAPHHSINPENWWQSSTFLETGEIMLELAEKYSDKIQWAFKPHPLLRGKLEKIWGKERTDAYYNKWENSEWSQYESGKYLGLFKYSDAMIHDCGSFIEEYHVTGNPVMYLIRKEEGTHDWNETVDEAYRLHQFGKTKEDIERFIINVIEGKDESKDKRIAFFRNNLTSPYGKTAAENIIECILDKKAAHKMRYKKFSN
jgi:hypothetical protein